MLIYTQISYIVYVFIQAINGLSIITWACSIPAHFVMFASQKKRELFTTVGTWRLVTMYVIIFVFHTFPKGPASWSSDQSLWLLIIRSGFDSRFYHGNFPLGGGSPWWPWFGYLVGLGLGRLRNPLAFHLHISPLTSSGRRNRASWASQPQKSVTLRHSQRAVHEVHENMWWHWGRRFSLQSLSKTFLVLRKLQRHAIITV
jgi:hypothetical protein